MSWSFASARLLATRSLLVAFLRIFLLNKTAFFYQQIAQPRCMRKTISKLMLNSLQLHKRMQFFRKVQNSAVMVLVRTQSFASLKQFKLQTVIFFSQIPSETTPPVLLENMGCNSVTRSKLLRPRVSSETVLRGRFRSKRGRRRTKQTSVRLISLLITNGVVDTKTL